jgi:hypothetical protein
MSETHRTTAVRLVPIGLRIDPSDLPLSNELSIDALRHAATSVAGSEAPRSHSRVLETNEPEQEGGNANKRPAPKETSADKRDYPWLPSSAQGLMTRPHNPKNGRAVR